MIGIGNYDNEKEKYFKNLDLERKELLKRKELYENNRVVKAYNHLCNRLNELNGSSYSLNDEFKRTLQGSCFHPIFNYEVENYTEKSDACATCVLCGMKFPSFNQDELLSLFEDKRLIATKVCYDNGNVVIEPLHYQISDEEILEYYKNESINNQDVNFDKTVEVKVVDNFSRVIKNKRNKK